MRNAVLHLQLATRRIGPARLTAICLAIAALGMTTVVTPATRAALADARETLASIAASRTSSDTSTARPDPLAAFEAVLIDRSTLPEMLQRIFSAGQTAGVALERGDYRMERDPGGGFFLYHAVLPVRSSYPRVRGFIDTVLSDLPGAALVEATFAREDVSTAETEAKLHFILLIREH